jgi:hypothetical protein
LPHHGQQLFQAKGNAQQIGLQQPLKFFSLEVSGVGWAADACGKNRQINSPKAGDGFGDGLFDLSLIANIAGQRNERGQMITDELSLGKFGKVWGSPVSATSKDLTRLCRATCYKFESAAKSESLSGNRFFCVAQPFTAGKANH